MANNDQKDDLFLDEAMKTVESLPTDLIRMIRTLDDLSRKTNNSLKGLENTRNQIARNFKVNIPSEQEQQQQQLQQQQQSQKQSTMSESSIEKTASIDNFKDTSMESTNNNNNNNNNNNISKNMKNSKNRQKNVKNKKESKKHLKRENDEKYIRWFEDLDKFEKNILSHSDEKIAVLDQSINSVDCMMKRLKKQLNTFENTFKPNTFALNTPAIGDFDNNNNNNNNNNGYNGNMANGHSQLDNSFSNDIEYDMDYDEYDD